MKIENCFKILLTPFYPRTNTNQVDVRVNALSGTIHETPTTESQITELARSVNENKIPLKDLNLSMGTLNLLAPHLHYVDCRDITFINSNETENFIENCLKARHLIINSDKLRGLYELPKWLKTLDCSNCQALEWIDCRNSCHLEKINCSNCSKLTGLRLFGCGALQTLDCSYSKIKELCCSLLNALQTLKLSNCGALKYLNSFDCANLKEIDCSNCQALEGLSCAKCPRLETLTSPSLPNCRNLNHSECPLLRQLPQIPPGAHVISYNSIAFISFEVDPVDLKNNPLAVLNHLGEAILKDKRMPNIVYLHSPGLDHGGLRRQLVTTLLKNQFPPEAYQTIGMLIALAAHTPLPLGRFLPNSFYYALLNIEEDTPEEKIQSLALYGVPDAEIEEVDHSLTLPIAWAAKGFREIADPKRFREMPLNDFVTKVAGVEVNWENFEKLAIFKDAKIKGYFKTFFEKNPHKILDTIELFTGSRALGVENIKFFVEEGWDKGKLFVMETCFQQVKLPPYDNYELFQAKLLKTLEYTSGQFGKA